MRFSFLPSHYDVICDSLLFEVGWLIAGREWQEEFLGTMSSREIGGNWKQDGSSRGIFPIPFVLFLILMLILPFMFGNEF